MMTKASAMAVIPTRDGGRISITVEGESVDECVMIATRRVVSWAIRSGERPPAWWEFWRPKWSKDCAAEYARQTVPGGTLYQNGVNET